MQKKNQILSLPQLRPQFILLLSSLLIVGLAYGAFFSNQRLLSKGGDGLKHYYSLSYFVKYGHNWDFDGMSYPYGEHFMFMDGHGIVGKMLHFVHHNLIDISDYPVGILHFWLFSWLIISPLFLFNILRHYEFKHWEAILTALLIFLLSPQLHRISGHQSLSYVAFVPMLWWLLIQMIHRSKPWIWASLYGGTALFFGWIHPYYMPLAAVFALSFLVTSTYRNGRFDFRRMITLSLAAFVPMLIFQIFMTTTDPFPSERGYVAGGFFQYMGTFEATFLPNFGIYFDFWHWLTGVKMQNGEAFNYIGFLGQIVFIVLGLRLLKSLFQRQWLQSIAFSDNTELNQFVQAAFLILLFSFALIFQWFPQLLEHFPPLRQFRSLGRFGWIFYYIFTVFTAFQIRQWLYRMHSKNKVFAISLTILAISIWSIEGYQNLQYQRQRGLNHHTSNHFLSNEFEKAVLSTGNQPTDFQAIIPLPILHVGSDKLAIFRSQRVLAYAFRASYEMHLPVAAYYSSRVPLAKSFEVLRWASHDLTRFEEDFAALNDKPLLLISANKELHKGDKRLLGKAKKIYESVDYNLYELDMVAYKKQIREKRQTLIDTYVERKKLVKIDKNIYANKPTKAIFINTFDDLNYDWQTPQPFGNQNYIGRGNQHLLFDDTLVTDYPQQQVEISVWTYSNEDLPSMPILKCDIYDDNGKLIERKEVLGMLSSETLGRWVRIAIILKASDHRHRIYLGYYNNFQIFNCYMDNFVIRPTGANFWYEENDKLYYNNYLLRKF